MTNNVVNTAVNEVQVENLFGRNPDGILAQEKRGQEQLAQSSVLPTDARNDAVATLSAAGVIFGNTVDGDPLFRHVTLPDGWKIRPTDHSMWTDLVDDTGKVRAAIFYKAAFYDRNAHMRIVTEKQA